MKFGTFPLSEVEGAVLAHAQKLPSGRIPKGARLGAREIAALREAGVEEVTVALLDRGDLVEDEAAARIAEALAGQSIGAAPAATGRANLFAGEAGLFLPDRALVDRLNAIHPGITLATLDEFAPVEPGRMVATVKIIPLAVPAAAVEAAVEALRFSPALRLAPFRARRVALIQTELPGVKPSVLDKTRRVMEERLRPSGSTIALELRCPHEPAALAQALAQSDGAEMVVVFGASAVIDEEDVVPAAIRLAGGTVRHLGMPVDPGNLLLLAERGGRHVLGAPGCARSPKENGFDWILNRLLADLPVETQDIAGLGVGGLLMEIASRPQPREAPAKPREVRVDILLLAAGRSSRMGGPNKLLAIFDGMPLVRRSVETALASRAGRVFVVVGHMREAIRAVIEGLDVEIVENPNYAAGLSTSLISGFVKAAAEAHGVLVMLADQPFLTSADLDRMIEAFEPTGEGSIVLASDAGHRANPVILASTFEQEIAGLTGDVGARGIVAANPELVREVEIGPAAGLDVDTPEAMARAGGVLPLEPAPARRT